MGRFLAIVIALVVIALAINYMQQAKPVGNDEPKLVEPVKVADPGGDTGAADTDAAADAEQAVVSDAENVTATDEPPTSGTSAAAATAGAAAAAVSGVAAQTPAAETPAADLEVADEPAAAEAARVEETVESPAEVAAPVVATATDEAATDEAGAEALSAASEQREKRDEAIAEADAALQETAEEQPTDEATKGIAIDDLSREEVVMLGGSELLQGIPGEGELTNEQIDQWLADPANRVVLKPELPLGLAAGAGMIQGIDENPLTRAKIELGRQLYFDTRLSSDNTISCASCHAPDVGYAKETRFGVGVGAQEGNRNSPTAYNRILSGAQFWDGRATSLEDQAIGPIANPIEMGNTHEVCVQTIAKIPGYKRQFDAIFEDGLSIENIGKAIASFERTIVTGPAPWDYYQQLVKFEQAYEADLEDLELLKEEDEELYNEYMELKKASEENPISESAIRGGELFFSDKAKCTTCHVGANFTDELYHNIGVGMDVENPDLGRFEQTGLEKDKGAFKTPTVRNVAQTGPYMHDGSQETLEEVVEWYVQGGHPNPWLSDKIVPLELTEQDKADLVAFLKEGITGSLPSPEYGRLPK